ncbi:(4Fe-4S)-binding protein [Bacillus sp. RG28]|uniref:(4Fe-4S)-binding protein n=1 Tax=Gottfriedia endophytica TaxID=2820819 RepID=A0A940SJA7_9BACI|nr:(4Fe-4S)-binding protein [Gottfriedia endophytica]MBP0725281.1 (4Fe-4S)-binding protein [Gottfriedia endophytica]
MNNDYKRYVGKQIDVIFHTEKCAHSARCVRGLPTVFDTNKKPWVNTDGEEADKIAEVIDQCPSGALEYIRKDKEEIE